MKTDRRPERVHGAKSERTVKHFVSDKLSEVETARPEPFHANFVPDPDFEESFGVIEVLSDSKDLSLVERPLSSQRQRRMGDPFVHFAGTQVHLQEASRSAPKVGSKRSDEDAYHEMMLGLQ